MKTSRIFLTITILTLIILVLTGCKGVVPPSPGTTEDITIISGQIKMPLTCCDLTAVSSKDGSNNNECDETEFWPIVPNAVVELKSAAKGKCKTVLATTLTDEDGNYVFEDVKPGLYIITAYCPEDGTKRFFLKDVAEKIQGEALDAGIPDCTSTSLALVIEKINNCYDDWYNCYNKWTAIYKLVGTIATDVGKVDIEAIMGHNRFGNYCDNIDDDLVDLVCAFSCCESPGTTPGPGPGPDPCAGHTAPYDVVIDNTVATVGEVYTGKVTAKDDDDDVLSFAFATEEGYTPPAGMTINSSTGVIIWDSPTVDDICCCEEAEAPVSNEAPASSRMTAPSSPCSPIQITVSDQCHSTTAQFCLAVEDAPTYQVYYDGNGNTGGTAPTDSNSYYEGDGATVLDEDTLVKTNYHFTGWNTKADGTGDAYAPDATLTMPAADVTLYAQWEEDSKYTVTYDANGGTGSQTDSNSPYYAGAEVTVLGKGTMAKANHTFTGWNTAANGTGTPYVPNDKFNMPAENVTLYAQWKKSCVNFSINVDYNVDSKGSHKDTILYWYAPPNHNSRYGGRDYVKVTITADRDLVAGEQVVLDFSQKSVSKKIMLEVFFFFVQTSNGTYNNSTGKITFDKGGKEFYAIFRKVTHDWGNSNYPNDKKVTLKLSSDISCPNPPTADINFDKELTSH